ncbi:MAG: hypothetical protein QMC89_02135 [Candidatus Hodarchaeaceae archaeon]|nr:hypothetical protein [Candidatus Hodarchaeaceae archaeon]
MCAAAVAATAYLASREPGEEGAPSLTISVSPKSLSVARGGSGTLTVTVSPPEYGSSISTGMTVAGAPQGVRILTEDASVSPIGPNSFSYTFGVVDNAPLGTYTVILTVATYVPSPPIAASDNFTLTVT